MLQTFKSYIEIISAFNFFFLQKARSHKIMSLVSMFALVDFMIFQSAFKSVFYLLLDFVISHRV